MCAATSNYPDQYSKLQYILTMCACTEGHNCITPDRLMKYYSVSKNLQQINNLHMIDDQYIHQNQDNLHCNNPNPQKGHFYTKDEVIDFLKVYKYCPDNVDWEDEDEVKELLRERATS